MSESQPNQDAQEGQETMAQLMYKRKLLEVQARFGRVQGAEADAILKKIRIKRKKESKDKKKIVDKMDEKLDLKFDLFIRQMEEINNNPQLKRREQILDKEQTRLYADKKFDAAKLFNKQLIWLKNKQLSDELSESMRNLVNKLKVEYNQVLEPPGSSLDEKQWTRKLDLLGLKKFDLQIPKKSSNSTHKK